MTVVRLARNGLVVLMGPAGSGKSFFARRFFRRSQAVSSDRCREMIIDDPRVQRVSGDAFELFYTIVEMRAKYGRLTVADATHLAAEYRARHLKIAERYSRPVYLIVFEAPLETCLERNRGRRRRVEEEVIRTQYAKFENQRDVIEAEKSRYTERFVIRPGELERTTVERF
ncbi:MAG: AAA family ATPase [Phycisphaerae bacterium]|nr:AAA family ATPase [Phycisphaerae bacterium]